MNPLVAFSDPLISMQTTYSGHRRNVSAQYNIFDTIRGALVRGSYRYRAPDTFDQFCTIFKNRYETDAHKLRAQKFYQTYQNTDEGVNGFHQRLMLAADTYNISKEEKPNNSSVG